MLRIVSASDPLTIENIVLTIYAAPGLGKTSLAFTADKPLMLDFDKGAHRAATRGDSVPVASWDDVSQMSAEDLSPYSTIIVDTAGRALDALSIDIITGNPKLAQGNGALSQRGYGELKSRFQSWSAFLKSLKKDLVLICHMDEQRNGDDTIERIDAQGSSKNEIYKSSDAMCRIRLDGRDQRFLDFDPRQGGFGKNPAQLPKIAFPDPRQNPQFLAGVIGQIKSALNRMTEDQAAARKEQEEWSTAVSEADTLDAINLLVGLSKERKLSMMQKMVLKEKAKGMGFEFDKASGKYAATAVAA